MGKCYGKRLFYTKTRRTLKKGEDLGWVRALDAKLGMDLRWSLAVLNEDTKDHKGIQVVRESRDDLEGVIPDTSVIRVIFIFLDGKASWSKGQRVHPIGVG